ncbi:hypothetical protein V5799_014568 [Amblyomma americanum]|uniref:Uncharacterized protein n=1 Tax=Amblyomma americanum TaxID=6943 RepID=A0AAQ4E2M9_AMBAM
MADPELEITWQRPGSVTGQSRVTWFWSDPDAVWLDNLQSCVVFAARAVKRFCRRCSGSSTSSSGIVVVVVVVVY